MRSSPHIFLISPHQDDAAFSLGITLLTLCRLRCAATIVNCFTESEYSPLQQMEAASVRTTRAAEDALFASRLEGFVSLVNLGCLDAPLRLGISSSAVCGVSPAEQDGLELASLLAGMDGVGNLKLALLPLGLGKHVDHIMAREAAIRAFPQVALGFYEDLPYASRGSDPAEDVAKLSTRLPVKIDPYVHRIASGSQIKRDLISGYTSQVSPQEMDTIANYSLRHGEGERLWLTPLAHKFLTGSGLSLV